MEESDEELMARVGRGERDACAALVARHLGRILAFTTRTLGDRAEAEDAAQEVFVRLWTHAARWEPRARLTTWLHRIALNQCLHRLERRRERALDDVAEPIDPAPTPLDAAQARDVGRHVNAELARLPDRQRIAITLCHYQGLGNVAAAEIMDVSVEALESLLARARRTLRARLRAVAPDLLGG